MNTIKKIISDSRFKLLIKFTFVGLLLFYLGKRGFLSLEETKKAFSRMDLVLPAFFFFFCSSMLGLFRWHLLLKAQDINLPIQRTYHLGFVGLFFNIALPGAVSGDVVKAIYVGKETPGKRAFAFSSILFDRVVGVSALVMVSAVSLLISLSQGWGDQLLNAIEFFLLAAAGVIIAFYTYLFLVGEKFDPLLRLFKWLEPKLSWVIHFTRTYEGIRAYRTKRGQVSVSILISIFIHIFVVSGCVLLVNALGVTHIQPLAIFVVVPLGLLVTAVPIAPAGVGTGHVAFSWLLLQLGSERGADVFTLVVLYRLIEGTFGGLLYLKFKSAEPEPISLNTLESGNGA